MKFYLFLFFLLCVVNLSVPSKIILAIGSTGLGKSFTATLFGFNAEVGHTSESKTAEVKVYSNEKYIYIDTPGFDDSNMKTEDEETIFNILSKIREKKITEVHTIFWFVHSDKKATKSLQKQAKLIESLARNKKNKASNIWDNVIVVYKGSYDEFDESAIENAIKKVNNRTDLTKTHIMNVFLYHKLKEDSQMRYLSKKALHKGGIYKEEELLDVYKKVMQEKHHSEKPVRVVFEDDTCVKCGIKGDRRLNRNSPCHIKEEQRHDKDENKNDLLEEYNVDTGSYEHPGTLTIKQDKEWQSVKEVIRSMSIPMVDIFRFIPDIGASVNQKEIWTCCEGDRDSRGCKSITSSKQRHTCCHKDKGTPGKKGVSGLEEATEKLSNKDLSESEELENLNKELAQASEELKEKIKEFQKIMRSFCAFWGKARGNSESCSRHEKHEYPD